jgi:putative ABC transport system ATP-binding protein
VAVVGASGSGKSTLMNMLGGLDQPDQGSIRISGQELARMSGRELARFRNKTVGFVFQQFELLPKKSALANVMLPLQYQSPRFADETDRALQSLQRVGLGDRVHHKPTELSGGQKQRVAIARALVTEPDILLADEPTGALDSKTSADVMALLQELNHQGITIILITHDHDVANYAARIITMRDGKIISDQPTGEAG